jgi:hypothetical protein
MVSLNVNAHSVTGVDADTSWLTTEIGMLAETADTLFSRKLKSNRSLHTNLFQISIMWVAETLKFNILIML